VVPGQQGHETGVPYAGPHDPRIAGDPERGGGSTFDSQSAWEGNAPRKGKGQR
jgi:hypothetical protein